MEIVSFFQPTQSIWPSAGTDKLEEIMGKKKHIFRDSTLLRSLSIHWIRAYGTFELQFNLDKKSGCFAR